MKKTKRKPGKPATGCSTRESLVNYASFISKFEDFCDEREIPLTFDSRKKIKSLKRKLPKVGNTTKKLFYTKSQIKKLLKREPNLSDYEKTYRSFTWSEAEKELAWFEGKTINAAHNAIGRQAQGVRKNKVALYWHGADETKKKFTFLLNKISGKGGIRTPGLSAPSRESYQSRPPSHQYDLLRHVE